MARNLSGWTLIEMMVVVLFIGVLAAIGIPSYLKSSENGKAQASIAVVAALGNANRMLAIAHPSPAGTPCYADGWILDPPVSGRRAGRQFCCPDTGSCAYSFQYPAPAAKTSYFPAADGTCVGLSINFPSFLAACNYLTPQDFDKMPYEYLVGPNGCNWGAWIDSSGAPFAPTATRVLTACSVRRGYHGQIAECAPNGYYTTYSSDCAGMSPYTNWGYAVDNLGVFYYLDPTQPKAVSQ